MRFFNEAPFVRLLLPFILGIIAGVYFLQNQMLLVVCSYISILILIAVIGVKSHSKAYKYSWLGGLAINAVLFFLGAQLTLNKTEILSAIHFTKHTGPGKYVIAELAEPSVEKEKTLKCIFRIRKVETADGVDNTDGKGLIYLQKDSLAQSLKYGDEIMFPADFKEISPPQNPGEFNYKRYLSFHNIYHQQYVAADKWSMLYINNGNALMSCVYKIRNSLLNKLKVHELKGDEYAVGAALILGYSDKLDAEIMNAYASTGTLHVLSVSGLHVGLVYVVFNFLLGFLERFKRGKLLKGILIIVLLWAYAALTGLSPAVLRATAMFSFVVLGQSLRRTTNIYNTLAVSCFVLILFNPFLIFDVGFQLSYLAVLGIVFLQPLIYNWWYINNWLLDQIWKITSVSIAAQLATLPVSLFYFHQFPNYFLLSNLIVIPVSTIVIYTGILVFALGNVPLLGALLGKTLNYLLLFLNGSVKFMEHLPYALWQGISISIIEVGVIYLLMILGIIYLLKKWFSLLVASLITLIILLAINLSEKVGHLNQQKLIVYNIPHTSAIDIIRGDTNYFISDTALLKNNSKMKFHVLNNWWDIGISKTNAVTNGSMNNMRVGAKSVVRIAKIEQLKGLDHSNTDYIILSDNCDISMYDLVKVFNFDLLIIDPSNSKRTINKWIQECGQLHKRYYNVSAKGAFVENI
jgi:competence protein ComEC